MGPSSVVSPEPCLRFILSGLRKRERRGILLGINKRRQPKIRARVHAPTVKMEFQIRKFVSCKGAIESNDRVFLVLDPDSPDEASIAGLLLWSYVKDQRAHFTQEFAADVIKII